jgi:hypothetical protein
MRDGHDTGNDIETRLERNLRRLTAPAERPADLVARAERCAAAEASAEGDRPPGVAGVLAVIRRRPARALLGAAAVLVGAIGLGLAINAMDPGSVDAPREVAASRAPDLQRRSMMIGPEDETWIRAFDPPPASQLGSAGGGRGAPEDETWRGDFDLPPASQLGSAGVGRGAPEDERWLGDVDMPPASQLGSPGGGSGAPDVAAGGRHIVRKASIEIRTADVAAAFQRVQLLVNEGQGEFIADSSQQGVGRDERASVTLRVRPARLGAVLTSVRAMGLVVSESRGGDDVTDRVVDLEARLRNERRVEQEMLELLEQRPDAPLDDILTLRRQLADVRGTIERYEGQRSALEQLVSLATVLVLIRMDPEAFDGTDLPTDDESLADRFGAELGGAWVAGLGGLIDSIATVVRVLLGGLLWWLLAAAVIILVVRRYGRA